MKEKNGAIQLVVVGLWNKAIFSNDWVKTNILNDIEKFKVEIPIGIDSSLRFTTDKISFAIVGNRLEIMAKELEKESFDTIITIGRKIFRLLPHTPVKAFGINHIFQYENEEFAFDNFFTFNDEKEFEEKLNEKLTTKIINRKFEINTNETLNISISSNPNEFGFNYNYNITKIEDIFEIIKENNEFVFDKREGALSMLENIYNLKL